MAGSGNGTWWNYALIQIREGSARMTKGLTMERPAHVPEELVRDYPIRMGTITPENPFDRMIPEIHAEMPAIFYSMDAYPGGSPAWIVRKAADLQAIYSDTVNFSNKDFAPFAQLVGESWSSLPAETDPPMHGLYRSEEHTSELQSTELQSLMRI